MKFELIVPVFFGCLGSLFFSALVMARGIVAEKQDVSVEAAEVIAEEPAAETGNVHFFTRVALERRDLILDLYREPQSQERVIDFFSGICASPEIVDVILAGADSFDIAPALAFALAWEESRLNPRAVNNRNRDGSIDRGLFQLNNRSFPRLEIQAFFNPRINAWYGMAHLRHCLDTGGSEVAALAMYNAGTGRVNSAGTPKSTLDYASRILANRWEIENRFRDQQTALQEQPEDIIAVIVEEKPERSILVPLMPLAGQK